MNRLFCNDLLIDFGVILQKDVFLSGTTILWKSDSPVSVVQWLWSQWEHLVTTRNIVDGFFRFLKQVYLIYQIRMIEAIKKTYIDGSSDPSLKSPKIGRLGCV